MAGFQFLDRQGNQGLNCIMPTYSGPIPWPSGKSGFEWPYAHLQRRPPWYKTNKPLLQQFKNIICLLGAKLNNDTLNLVTYLNLKKAFTARFVGVWMLLSRFTSRFLGLFIPYLNFGFRTLGVHPFVFYGFVWVLCRLSFSRVREISCLKDEKEIPLIVLKKEERIWNKIKLN